MLGFQQTAQFGYDPCGEERELIDGCLLWDSALTDKITLEDLPPASALSSISKVSRS